MPKDYSPFTPDSPVRIEFFVGRKDEINRLREKAAISTTGRLQVAFLSGERGIGKSSLASFVRYLVERDHQVLGLHGFFGGVTTLTELIRRVFDCLLNESVDKMWYSKVKDFFGDHIRKVGLFGVSLEFGAGKDDLEHIVRNFAPALRKLTQRLRDDKKGIFVILDDINGLASSEDFANWLKSLVDEIATAREPLPLCLVLVGLDERRQSLISLQPSLARVFDVIEIRAWQSEETRDFFQNTFSKVDVAADEQAIKLIVRYAGGLPVLAHEIGDAVFKVDRDNRIDMDDASAGLVKAAEIVGQKHLEPQVLRAIRSKRYQTILKKVGREGLRFKFQRGRALTLLNEEEGKVFDNFLKRMADLGVIIREPEEGPGAYRFSNLLHHLYFSLEAQRAKVNRRP